MLKHCPRTPAGWARTAARCGVIALGAGLVAAVASTSAEAAAPAHGTITGSGVNVRSTPSLKGTVVGTKNIGNRVAMYCSHRDAVDGIVWDEIQVSAPQWVAAGYVHVDSGTVPPCDGLGSGDDAVADMAVSPAAGIATATGIASVGPMTSLDNQAQLGSNVAATATAN